MKHVVGVSSGCFLYRKNGYVMPKPIPPEFEECWFELQVGRGYFFNDLVKVITVHLPFREYYPTFKNGEKFFLEGRSINIATLDYRLRKKWLERFEKIISEAASRDVKATVVHYGSCDCGINEWKNESHRMRHWKAEADFLGQLLTICEDKSVKLLVENHPYNDTIFLSHLEHMKAIIDNCYALICLDLPHAYYREVKGEVDVKTLAKTFKNEILEVHLADGDGSSHTPLQLGMGKIEIKSILKELTKTMFFIVELRENPSPSLEQARKLLKELENSLL